MTFNGIDFSWVQDEKDKKLLIALWKATCDETAANLANNTKNKTQEKLFKKAYQQIRDKQILSRKEAFEKAHGKLNAEISRFGNLINLKSPLE